MKKNIMINTEPHQIKIEDLPKAFEILSHSSSSSDNMTSLMQENPLVMMVHNEVLKHSAKDLENTPKGRFGYDLYDLAINSKKPPLLAALIKKGAYQNKLTTMSKFLLDIDIKPNNDFYDLIFTLESSRNVSRNKVDMEDFLTNLFYHYLTPFHSPEQAVVLDKVVEKFGEKNKKDFCNFIIQKYDQKHASLFEYLVIKMKHHNIQVDNVMSLNHFLPNGESNREKFFIYSEKIPFIKTLLKLGFKFNEKEYAFNGKNLFVTVASSTRDDIKEAFIPYLNDITPKGMTLDEQTQLIENLVQPNQGLTRLIQAKYLERLLELQVKKNDKTENKSSLKI